MAIFSNTGAGVQLGVTETRKALQIFVTMRRILVGDDGDDGGGGDTS